MKPSEQARFDTLLEWSEKHGGKLHPSLEIYNDNVTKYSLRVKPSTGDALQPGFRAVTCPATTTLSYLNALIDGPIKLTDNAATNPTDSPPSPRTGAFPPSFTQSVPPHVLGRFFLIKEYLKGKDSFWWPYLATLPSPDQVNAWVLPAFWPEDDIAYLECTNAHVAIQEIQANVKGEFKQARKILKNENFPDVAAYTSLMYKWAFTIFTSRSFRPSLILSDTTKRHISTLLPQSVELDDFSILQPLLDIANHSPTAVYSWDTTSPADACTLLCGDRYPPGAQVFNNYGLKTNSELLLGYGFILQPTPSLHNDYVHLRKTQQRPPSSDPTITHNPHLPQTFLVSLRPVTHPSSAAVYRARPTLNPTPSDDQSPTAATTTMEGATTTTSSSGSLALLPCFAHFEPALLTDLATTLATPAQLQMTEQWLQEAGAGRQVGVGVEVEVKPPSREVAGVVEMVRAALGGKLRGDHERLMEVGLGEEGEEEGDGDRLPPPRTENQRLAVAYRGQYARVLEAALESLMMGGDWGASAVWNE